MPAVIWASLLDDTRTQLRRRGFAGLWLRLTCGRPQSRPRLDARAAGHRKCSAACGTRRHPDRRRARAVGASWRMTLSGLVTESGLPALVAFAIVATVTPGGANLLAAASGARFGLWRSLPLLAGLSFGLAALVAIAGAGLGALVSAAPTLRVAMRLAGSAYLLWLAWRIACGGPPGLREREGAAPAGFPTGIALLWLNPKAWTMGLAASAIFAGLSASPKVLAVTLGAVFGAAAAISLTLWCTCGFLLARVLRTHAQWRVANAALGTALAASVIPMWW